VVCLPVNLPNVFMCSLDSTSNVGRQIMAKALPELNLVINFSVLKQLLDVCF